LRGHNLTVAPLLEPAYVGGPDYRFVTTAKKDAASTATVVSITVNAVLIHVNRADRVSAAIAFASPASAA
jgi:hypothetical protein